MDPTFPLGSGRCCHVPSTPEAVGFSTAPHIRAVVLGRAQGPQRTEWSGVQMDKLRELVEM